MSRGRRITQADVINVAAVRAIDPMMPTERVGEIIGRSGHAVRQIETRFGAIISEYRRLNSRSITEDIDSVRRALLAHAAEPDTIAKMSGLQALTGFGILTDKLLLESGRPTQITLSAHADISITEVLGRLRKALDGRTGTTSGGQGQAVDGT